MSRLAHRTAARLALLLSSTLVVGACVKDHGLPYEPMCQDNSDCAGGTSCTMNICVGNPPNLHFAAEIYPPDDRKDLSRVELPSLEISKAGAVSVPFSRAVPVSGRVVLAFAPLLSVPAKIVFSRPSRIAGGPDFSITVDSSAGLADGDSAFHVSLPPNLDGEDYDVTIYPDDGSLVAVPPGIQTPAELAPPIRKSYHIADTTQVTFVLGDTGGLKEIAGTVRDAHGKAVPGATVRAFGRYTPTSILELASSIGRTGKDGAYSLWVPVSWDDTFELEVRPPRGMALPTLHRANVNVPDPMGPWVVDTLPDLLIPDVPPAASYVLPIVGQGAAGGQEPAAGAVVTLTTVIATSGDDSATYQVQAIADAHGVAQVSLIPGIGGPRPYQIDVVPLPESSHAGVWGYALAVPPPAAAGPNTMLPPVTLGDRVFVTGRVLDHAGEPVDDLKVRATPSPGYTMGLAPDQTDRLSSVLQPEVVTQAGAFGIYLDSALLGQPTTYDLELEPPASSLLPEWSVDRLGFDGLPTSVTTESLPDITLPDARYAIGKVLDADGNPVADAEVRLYVLEGAQATCLGKNVADCPAPARLRGLARSSADGTVILVLPAPDSAP